MKARAVAVALALVLLGVVGAAQAAEPNHAKLYTIAAGRQAEPPSQVDPLKDACGVAVDGEGRVFVSNYYDHAVYVFAFSQLVNAYVPIATIAIPEAPNPPSGKPVDGPCDLALDSAGNLYVNNWHRNVIRLHPTSPKATTFEPGLVIDSNHPTGVAVDPLSGRVFIDDRTSIVEYEAAPTESSLPLREIGAGAITDGYSVAVSGFTGDPAFPSTAGWVYVADAADDTVKAFDPAKSLTEPEQKIDGDGTPQAGFNHLADTDIAVDSRDGHVYVVDNLQPGFEQPEAVADEFSSLGHYLGPVPPEVASGHPSGVIDAEPSSIAISGEGEVFLSSGNYFNDGTILPNGKKPQDSQVQVFGPAAKAPTAILTASKSGAGAGTVFSSDPAGLRCGTACEGEFPLGRTVLLVAEPAPHSRFAGWAQCPDPLIDGRCQVTMSEDVKVKADFEPIPSQTLSVTGSGPGQGTISSSPAGIDCGGGCTAGFDEGSRVTLNATAAAGSSFAGWTGCDSEPASGACTVTMVAARSVSADFEPIPVPPPLPLPVPQSRTLSVTATGLGGATGSVTSSPGGIDCGGTCAGLYVEATTVTLEAHPAAGSTFVGWGGCDNSDGDRCTVTLGTDKVVVAAFGPGSPGPLRIRGVAVHGASATLRVAVPAAGALSAGSPKLKPASALPIQAGTVALRLKLNEAGSRAFSRSRRHRLAVPVALMFTPFAGGSTVAAKRTVVFGTTPVSAKRK